MIRFPHDFRQRGTTSKKKRIIAGSQVLFSGHIGLREMWVTLQSINKAFTDETKDVFLAGIRLSEDNFFRNHNKKAQHLILVS